MSVLAALITAVGTALGGVHADELKPRPDRQVSHPPAKPGRPALASWYDDAGSTASGRHYTYGYASLLFGSDWGHAVQFCYRGRCATGRLDDHGPYVSGRTFDLNPALKGALGCPDLCQLTWRDA